MGISQETLNKLQSVATILSLIAVPFLVAYFGYTVQERITGEGIKKDYVQIAASILKEKGAKEDVELRRWAVDVLDVNAPVPFSPDVRKRLELGLPIVISRIYFPEPPDFLMGRPLELMPLPKKEPLTNADLLKTVVENYRGCHENRATLELLQQWLRETYQAAKDVEKGVNKPATKGASG